MHNLQHPACARGRLTVLVHVACSCFACLCAAAFGITRPAPAATYVVDPGGGGDFPTIQAAVDVATDGDVIELLNGTFTGDGNRDVDFLGKAITIRSQSGHPESCVIDCRDPSGPHRGFIFQHGEGSNSVIEGLTITGGHGYNAGGAILVGADALPTLLRCRFIGNAIVPGAGGGGAVLAYGAIRIEECAFFDNLAEFGGAVATSEGNSSILGCTFARNHASEAGGAVILGLGVSRLSECTFYANQAPAGSGLWTIASPPSPAHVDLDHCIVAYGEVGSAVRCDDFATVTLTCCDLFGNEGGDWVECAQGLGENGNISEDPSFCGAENDDYTLGVGSPCAPDHNPDCGLIGAWPVGCAGPVPVEETTWGRIKARYEAVPGGR
jgi:hypothetical protein